VKIIHINRNIIQSNAKHGTDNPVCRVEHDGVVTYCMEVNILGPSSLVYRPDSPRPCGAKLWIETEADLIMLGVRERTDEEK
jgi:hypothetical protein